VGSGAVAERIPYPRGTTNQSMTAVSTTLVSAANFESAARHRDASAADENISIDLAAKKGQWESEWQLSDRSDWTMSGNSEL